MSPTVNESDKSRHRRRRRRWISDTDNVSVTVSNTDAGNADVDIFNLCDVVLVVVVVNVAFQMPFPSNVYQMPWIVSPRSKSWDELPSCCGVSMLCNENLVMSLRAWWCICNMVIVTVSENKEFPPAVALMPWLSMFFESTPTPGEKKLNLQTPDKSWG